MFDDPDSPPSRRELLEVRNRFQYDFGRESPSVLDEAFDPPLGRDGWRHSGIDDASPDVPFLVGPRDRLVAEGRRIPIPFANQDTSLDVHVELGLLRLREGVNHGGRDVVRADRRSLDGRRLPTRENKADEGGDRLAEFGWECDDEVHLLDAFADRLRHRRELRVNRVISLDDPDRGHELGALEAGERADEPDLALAQERCVEGELVEDRANRVWRDELAGLAAGNDRAAAPEHDLLNFVELARTVHPHDIHRARGRADPEDARDARGLGPRIEGQLAGRLMVKDPAVPIVSPPGDH